MAFVRPQRPHLLPPWHGAKPPGAAQKESAADEEQVVAPSPSGSWLALFTLALTGVTLIGDTPHQVATYAATGTAIAIAFSLFFDSKLGLRNVVRADVLALVGLYFLTLFEFLFSQPEFNSLTDVTTTRGAVMACLLGHAGIIAGRHIRLGGQRKLRDLLARPAPTRWLIVIFLSCLFIGHLQMLIAVNFDIFRMIDAFMGPRFSQPWGRGRLGDWRALLYELSMLLYLVPPIAGIFFARRKLFSVTQLAIVAAGLGFEMFYAFCSGTRNLFISYLVTFLIGYAFALQRGRHKELLAVVSGSVVLALLATVMMLQFRSVGLKQWIAGNRPRGDVQEKMVHVDMNLYVISTLVATFPKHQPFLGLEVPYLALIRPIPRALWPGKPEGMSVSLEDAAGADSENWTVAASFVGEAYIAGGMIAVFITGLFFGCGSAWWSRLASSKNSELGILIYASGFFAAAISMRSLFAFTTALLPTIAAILGVRFLLLRLAKGAARMLGSNRRPIPRRPARGPAPAPRPPNVRRGAS
jgi:hypothetical protein